MLCAGARERRTAVLKKLLEERALFSVDVATTPPKGADLSGFRANFAAYTVTLLSRGATVRFLRARNREGWDVYINPYADGRNAGYILVDLDHADPQTLQTMEAHGLRGAPDQPHPSPGLDSKVVAAAGFILRYFLL